jgi:5-formyltetrahydrofolate cyclo-ligase
MSPAERDRLRRHMRAQRRCLSAHQRAQAALRIARIAQRHLLLRPGKHVAVYIAHGSEVDLSPLIDRARQRGCILYLPAISDYRCSRMDFVRFDADAPLRANRYGIPEPERRNAARIPPRQLDLIFVPLVAFDANGWRLGSGAGFYDRALRHLRIGRRWRRPQLIGVGYELQRVPQLEPAPWDVPLDAAITQKNLYPARHPHRDHE